MTPHNDAGLRAALPLSALALALAAAWSPAAAQNEDKFSLLTKPESTLRLGLAGLDEDGTRFGQYRGPTQSGFYGLADLDLVRRDDATGTWFTLSGRDLGLDSREARIDLQRQGQWRLFGAYGETQRTHTYTVNSGLQGVGGGALTVQTAGKRDLTLETKRKLLSLGLDHELGGGLSVQLRASSETKDGTRQFGRGNFATPPTFNFLAEPIDRRTHTLEASLNYVGERLQLQGGYRASAFDAGFNSLSVNGGGAALNGAGVGTFSPIALPPGNQAHHVYLSGAWDLGAASTLRGNFKAARTHATQTESFIGNPPGVNNTATTGNISGRSELGGHLDTTLVQAGVSARPLPKLSLNANLRFEDRDDKTPSVIYTTPAGTSDGYNEARSIRYTSGKLAVAYQLPDGYKLGASADLETQHRREQRGAATPSVRSVSWRDRLDETSLRLDLRRAFSDTLNGSLALVHADRDGSAFDPNKLVTGANGSNLIAPVFLADRVREKLRLDLDWMPAEAWNVQLSAEDTRDRYDTRHGLGLGVRRGGSQFYAVDASLALSDAWKLNAWTSHSSSTMFQATGPNAAASPASPQAAFSALTQIWSADLALRSYALGLGVRGQAMSKLKLGAELQRTRDRSSYSLAAEKGAAIPTLPDIVYRVTTVRAWSLYEVSKNFGIRLDYEFDRRKIDDWTWTGFTYASAADGTTVTQDVNPKVHFIGVSAVWKWR